MKVDEDNMKTVGMVKGQSQKVCQFSINGFCNNIGFLVSDPTFGFGGLIL